MNQKVSALLMPRFGLYFLMLTLFAVAAGLDGNYVLAIVEGVVVVVLFLVFRYTGTRRKKAVEQYIEAVNGNVEIASRDAMINCPLPMVIFQPDTDDVIWSNDRFLQLSGDREHVFDTKLSAAVPGFDSRWLLEGKTECPTTVSIGDRRFQVFGHLARADDKGGFLATTYWLDVTDYTEIREVYEATRPVVAVLLLDNYEDTMKGVDEGVRAAMLHDVNQYLASWTENTGGLFCRLDRDRFLFVFEHQYLSGFIQNRFSILDEVHAVHSPMGLPVTLSIGVGLDADTFDELYDRASLAVEMALSRGGDQAVLKDGLKFDFYGGRSKETEKRTKVKSRVMANAIGELISDSSCVFVMGHQFPDLDTIGAAAGICAIARKKGVPSFIIQESTPTPADVMMVRLKKLPEYAATFISDQDALIMADPRSLLVVVDTNRPEQVQSDALLVSCSRVAVIDHHRRAATYIEGAALNFHEPYASSASELVSELISYTMEPSDLRKTEAEAMLAGIVLDTKSFTMRTGSRTFEAAAFLRRAGADTGEVKKNFQNDLAGTLSRYDIIRNAKVIHGDVAIAPVDHTVGRVPAAQAADELLNVAGINTSFVLFPDGSKVFISARSMNDTNVQVICEALGGGGNAASAGAQLPDTTLEKAIDHLTEAINQYFEDA